MDAAENASGVVRAALRWGKDQTVRYFDNLEACCQVPGKKPAVGHACDQIRPGLRRM